MTGPISVYLEIGNRRAVAGALDWPGWCRVGRDEAAALQNLVEYGQRYARVLRPTALGFEPPADLAAFVVVERLPGNATTDYGVPGLTPSSDSRPLDETELRRQQDFLQACWQAFDAAVDLAQGKTLRTGPRGGGRSVEGIVHHVLDAEVAYLSQLGAKLAGASQEGVLPPPDEVRAAILAALGASARGELPAFGPRGGKRWSARYFVRRDAWHVLDHVWEIEDRMQA